MRIGIVILLAGLLAACGGGSSEPTPDPAPVPAPPTNNIPTISGSPATTVTQDQPYSFTPTANDTDGDALTFSITGQPTWSNFDGTTGSLTGTPNITHVGTTPGVTISVSDGSASASLAPFDLEVAQIQLGAATVSWDVPSTNADGSLLTDLAGYQVHYGTTSGSYTSTILIDDPTMNAVLIENLAPGTWYFAVKAVDHSDNESSFSVEVSKVVNP